MDTVTKILRRGLMLVLSSPSGAGKSTISRRILDEDKNLTMSVSITTRSPRVSEIDGEHYHFCSIPDFKKMVRTGSLLEHAQVFGNYYGTPKDLVERELHAGRDVLFDIDWQGARQLRDNNYGDLVSIFILPPSYNALRARLRERRQDTDDIIAQRMSGAISEINHWAEYDYVIINDRLEDGIAKVRTILAAERLRRERQTGLSKFINTLLNKT